MNATGPQAHLGDLEAATLSKQNVLLGNAAVVEAYVHVAVGCVVLAEHRHRADNGEPRRASAEGGSYFLRGDRLILTHDYNFVYGDEVRGLAATPPSYRILGAAAATELCTVEMTEDFMTLSFPSGNSMTFRRSSEF